MSVWRLDPDAEPGSVGMDASTLDKLAETFASAVEDGALFGGAQLAVYRAGVKVLDTGGGVARERTGMPVAPDTMFVIFSSTKGLAALAMLMLYERGKFHYDEPVIKYWPSFADAVPEKRSVSIRHIMSHRGGFPLGPGWLTARYWGDRDAIRRGMQEVPLRFTPGERNAYHAMNFGHMVNELIERIDGRDCGRFLREEVFEPLGLRDIYVGLPDDPALEARMAWVERAAQAAGAAAATGVTSQSDDGGAPAARAAPSRPAAATREVPEQHRDTPELSEPFNRPAVHQAVLPAGGGIATARDLAAVYAPLALGGKRGDLALVRKESLDHATTPTNRREDQDGTIRFNIRWGTGWHMGGYGRGSSLRTFGHGGAGGQVGFADPDTGLAFAFTTTGQRKLEYQTWRQELQSLAFDACRD